MASEKTLRDLQFSFDVGCSSIGWSVLKLPTSGPEILGCGTVTFPTNDCLASQRRTFRRQRRHIRATKRRIQRLEQLLSHLGVLTAEQIAAKHQQAGGHAAPWLLAARVLVGGKLLTWPELWDVIRWYAHNRGYDGNRRWSKEEAEDDDEDNTEKEENARKIMQKHGTQTMAETFCRELDINPLDGKKSSDKPFKRLNAAFPRSIVEAEVRLILRTHFGKLPQLDAIFETTLFDNARLIPCPSYKLPARFQDGLLFGQSVPRFDNRIISICPVSGGKVCSKSAPEFLLYRWLMQLANVRIDRPNPALTKDECAAIHKKMVEAGAFTPGQFKKAVEDATGKLPNNIEAMLTHPDAAKALVLNRVTKLIQSERVQFLWPHLPERIQKRAKGKWRNGDTLKLSQLLAWCDEIGSNSAAILLAARQAAAGKSVEKKSAKAKKTDAPDVLDIPLKVETLSGRAPYARQILQKVADEILSGLDPRKKCRSNDPLGGENKAQDGCVVTTEAMTATALSTPLDKLTNNHLVRHRLLILQKLTADLVADANYGAGDSTRLKAVAIEVNSELKEMSGKTAKMIAMEMGLKLADFKSVIKKLEEAGISNPSPGLIRKARVAEDLGRTCPYSGRTYDLKSLQSAEKWDKDHIIPHADRPSNSLDSLVITSKAINLEKKKRTGLAFVTEMNLPENLKRRDELGVWTVKQYKDFVENLKIARRKNPTSGEWDDTDDGRRQRRRKALLLKLTWDEKDKGFLPRDLTVTSHLTRLGALVLRKTLPHLQPHEITSLPGSVTGTIRTGWKLLGCLAAANPGVLDAQGKLKTKTEIRDVTHLHHALDAIVIGLTWYYFPKDGRLWEAMVRREKQRNADDNALLLNTRLYHRTQYGVVFAQEQPEFLVKQIRSRLAEHRVVQHIPADMGGIGGGRLEQMQRGIVLGPDKKPLIKDGKVKLQRRERGLDGKLPPKEDCYTWENTEKLVGWKPTGRSKLTPNRAVLVNDGNYGLALDPEPSIIPWHKVWHRLEELKQKNGGNPPRILRNGQLIKFKERGIERVWRVCSIKNTARGIMLDIAAPDEISFSRGGNRVATFLKNGLEIQMTFLTGSPQSVETI